MDGYGREVRAKETLRRSWRHMDTCAALRARMRAWLEAHVAVVDPSGAWLHRWDEQVRACVPPFFPSCLPAWRAVSSLMEGSHVARTRLGGLLRGTCLPHSKSDARQIPCGTCSALYCAAPLCAALQFSGLAIQHLRSPASVHPEPCSSYALDMYAAAARRTTEVYEMKVCVGVGGEMAAHAG